MKLILFIACAIVLTEAKPKKPERNDNSECTDVLPEEACQMIALNRGCIDVAAAINCRRTCKVCQICEDTSEHYCQVEMEKGTLDCTLGEHADYCQKTCGKCGDQAASRTKNRKGSHTKNKKGSGRLRRHRRDEDDCTDDASLAYCRHLLTTGNCDNPAYKAQVKKCARTCDLCFECEDLSSLCGSGIDVCGQEELEHFCLKSCDKCNRRSMAKALAMKAKRAANEPQAEDPLAHLLRDNSECSDISHSCHKFLDDPDTTVDICAHDESSKFCRKTCKLCNSKSQRSIVPQASQAAQDPLLALVILDHKKRSDGNLINSGVNCKDDVEHCDDIKAKGLCENFEINHLCKLTCGLCPLERMVSKCQDNASHCEEIKEQGLCGSFETNHICKLTCGVCEP